jgi:hypothetical protein
MMDLPSQLEEAFRIPRSMTYRCVGESDAASGIAASGLKITAIIGVGGSRRNTPRRRWRRVRRFATDLAA